MEFAPVNTTGNFRSLKFIKYIGNFGIRPIIVSFIPEEAAKIFNAKIDKELLTELSHETIIYRVPCDDIKTHSFERITDFIEIYFSIKDSLAKRWKAHVFEKIGDIIEKHQPKILYTSLPPFSSGMLTAEISKKFKIPFILDMRDLWSHLGFGPFGSIFHYWLTLREERNLYRQAAAVIGVTPQMIETFHRLNPGLNPEKFHLISNGFDSDLNAVQSFEFCPHPGKIVIGYIGSFYYEPKRRENTFKPWWKKRGHHMLEYNPAKMDWLYRSPYFFLKVVALLKKSRPAIGNLIKIEFIGKKPLWLDSMMEEFGLSDDFVSYGFVSREESLRLQQGFDIMLATSEKNINGEHYCLPSKLFDFIGLNKPILGFVTDGIQKEFIKLSGLGIICDPDNTGEAANALADLLTNGKKFTPNLEYLGNFHRRNVTEKLSSLIQNLTS
jgi:glycosyltransferase involved in cell wall biosynthesis